LTIRKFRAIDLAVFTLIALVLDIIIGLQGLFGLRTYFALSVPILLVLLMRWKQAAMISVGVVALLHLFLYDVAFAVSAANAVSLLSLGIALLITKARPFQAKRVGPGFAILYYLVCYSVMFLVEWTFLWLFGRPLQLVLALSNHAANFLIGMFLFILIYVQKDLFVSMQPYLVETSEKGK
jgi:hypothetical protein